MADRLPVVLGLRGGGTSALLFGILRCERASHYPDQVVGTPG